MSCDEVREYSLEFDEDGLAEWKKLAHPIQTQFKKKLQERLKNPHVPASRLHGSDMHNCYKIKLRAAGYRLVYEVIEDKLIVRVISVGKRDRNAAYKAALFRLQQR